MNGYFLLKSENYVPDLKACANEEHDITGIELSVIVYHLEFLGYFKFMLHYNISFIVILEN